MDIFQEFIKCHNDFFYFAENYLKISHTKKGIIPYSPYGFQKRLVECYNNNRFVIGKKFRQGGFSTTNVLYAVWKCLFHLDERILFLTATDREARLLSRIARIAIENLPDDLKNCLYKDTDHEKCFSDTGSKISFYSCQTMHATGLTHMFVEEPAYIKNMDDWWKCMKPIIDTGGKCFVTSTPSGTKNWFYETYIKALEGNNEFVISDCHYTEHPDFTPEFMNKVKNNLGDKIWRQEFECEFIPKQKNKITIV